VLNNSLLVKSVHPKHTVVKIVFVEEASNNSKHNANLVTVRFVRMVLYGVPNHAGTFENEC